ncbi:MAG: SUMF1/EgtB/PvdO family nonheme iron enzyme [Gammaproteobacteria bacterium]|nr:SUMF1/EgtB/PvdO family nonheme iron enzyme [Gammaproteobacteria bacterium]
MELSGKTILQLRKRLGDDWEDLAVYFDIPRERRKAFRPGRETDEIVDWLREREWLGKLAQALEAIDRNDLLPLLEKGSSSNPRPAQQTPWPRSPFLGLRRFNPEDALIFCGRYRETKQLVDKLKRTDPAHRFIAVVGASGSGKSSLVAAGLIPQLQANGIAGSQDWPCVEFTPGGAEGDPYPTLTARLEPLLCAHGIREREIIQTLRGEHGFGLIELAERVLSGCPSHAELLVFIDQFEELFTLTEEKHRQPFIRLLTRTSRASRVRIVVTMRADFFHRCLDYPGLDRLLQEGSYPLGPPGPGALYEMMTGPAAVAGLSFEDKLVDRILGDIGTEPGALALMAFALHELYEARTEDGHLTRAAYESFGGVQQAISQRAENTFKSLEAVAQGELERVFRELVQVDERGVATRQRAPLATLGDGVAAQALVDRLVDTRLLVRTPGEDGRSMVEVAHEALFRTWPRLAQWIQDTADEHRLRRQITQLAAYWNDHNRQDEHRWPDGRVVEAVAMMERLKLGPADFTDLERDFLGPLDPASMLATLDEHDTPHRQRAIIGVRLALLGDPRPGVGLRQDGMPDIVWCDVEGGEVTLEDGAGTFSVKPFRIAKYPVTYGQYRAFLNAEDGYRNPEWWQGLWVDRPPEEPGRQFKRYSNHPAENVAWVETVPFCRWLSVKLACHIRLPTEWEWQLAATGSDQANSYPWGLEWEENRANTCESEISSSTAVGMYPKGESLGGISDMSGNVWEWCLNEFDNLENIDLAGDARRVVRGGSWDGDRTSARAAYRNFSAPGGRGSSIGFRVVCASPI